MKRSLALIVSVLVAIVLSTGIITSAAASQATPEIPDGSGADLEAATAWLISQQDDSGGFVGFSGEPEVSVTIDAVIALVSAQQDGVNVGQSIDNAIAWLESGDEALVYAQTGMGQAAKLVVGIVAYGGNPNDIAGVDPLALIEQGPSEETGFYGAGPFDHGLALLALGATNTEVPAEAITILEESRTPEGGWSFDGTATEGAADSNTTSIIIQGLVATGHGDSSLVSDALAYLQTTLVGTSGATFQPSDDAAAEANSTALVTQAVIAVGDDPTGAGWGDLSAAMAAFQNESGAFHYNDAETEDNLFSTVQAIPAVAGVALPIVPGAETDATPIAWAGDQGPAA